MNTQPSRQTKIVATLGPASDGLIPQLVSAGVDVFRCNFSHGTHAEHEARIRRIREAAQQQERFVAVLGDLQGPKIRITGFSGGRPVVLQNDAAFAIDTAHAADAGTGDIVGTTYKPLPAEVMAGDVLVLGDGLVELEVQGTQGTRVDCRVRLGGKVASNQGINKRGGGLSAPALTDKDHYDLAFACGQGVDYLAVSFPRAAQDIEQARELIEAQGAGCRVIAKLERVEAVRGGTLDEIILAADGVMVARGDLGIEIGDARLVGVQKRIIERARELNRPVITATQMMESMINNPRATRAEVMDVANAVIDGTDAVMLSGETAVGDFPLQTVQSMVRIVVGAESVPNLETGLNAEVPCETIDQAVALAAMTVAERLDGVRAVACLTASGNTPRLMSRIRSRLPIYALGDSPRTLGRVALYRGVHPVRFETAALDYDKVNAATLERLLTLGAVAQGDRIILSKGDFHNVQGGTNTLKIVDI
ncbi:MAG: pyruvate kinase [Pseudomonadota bacterium]